VAFKTTHATALGKRTATVTVADESAVDAALDAYKGPSLDAQTLLGDEALLDTLKAKIEQLKGADPIRNRNRNPSPAGKPSPLSLMMAER
jgi:hypothetical protein